MFLKVFIVSKVNYLGIEKIIVIGVLIGGIEVIKEVLCIFLVNVFVIVII